MTTETKKRDPKDMLRLIVIITVCIVWAGSWAAKLFIKEYEAPAGIDVAFSLVCGYLLVTYNKGDGDDEEDSDGDGSTSRRQVERS